MAVVVLAECNHLPVLFPVFVHVHTVSPERDPCRPPIGFILLVDIRIGKDG